MLIDYEYKSGYLVCSYVNDKGMVSTMTFRWKNPYDYVECSHNDPDKHEVYETWDGCAIKKEYVNKPNNHSIAYFLYNQPEDVQEKLFGIYKPNKMYIDIETEIVSGFPDPKLAETRILTIAAVMDDKVIFLSLKELTDEQKKSIATRSNEYVKDFETIYRYKFLHFKNEVNMLRYFFESICARATLLTGWNFLDFDWMFLMKRAIRLGFDIRKLSITGGMNPHDKEFVIPKHKMIFDYQEIYVKYQQSVKVKESTSLDFVAGKLLGVKKVEYNGSLMDLYHDDFETYAFYNIIDTILVKCIDEKEKYIDIMYSISSRSRCRVKDALKTVSPTEGFIRENMKNDLNICFVRNKEINPKDVEGAWVKERENMMVLWVAIFDFASLYPTTQRQNFIAPENYIGMVDETGEYAVYEYPLLGTVKTKIDKDIHNVTDFNTVFLKRESPTINFLSNVYKERKVYKKKAGKEKEKIKLLKELSGILQKRL